MNQLISRVTSRNVFLLIGRFKAGLSAIEIAQRERSCGPAGMGGHAHMTSRGQRQRERTFHSAFRKMKKKKLPGAGREWG